MPNTAVERRDFDMEAIYNCVRTVVRPLSALINPGLAHDNEATGAKDRGLRYGSRSGSVSSRTTTVRTSTGVVKVYLQRSDHLHGKKRKSRTKQAKKHLLHPPTEQTPAVFLRECSPSPHAKAAHKWTDLQNELALTCNAPSPNLAVPAAVRSSCRTQKVRPYAQEAGSSPEAFGAYKRATRKAARAAQAAASGDENAVHGTRASLTGQTLPREERRRGTFSCGSD